MGSKVGIFNCCNEVEVVLEKGLELALVLIVGGESSIVAERKARLLLLLLLFALISESKRPNVTGTDEDEDEDEDEDCSLLMPEHFSILNHV